MPRILHIIDSLGRTGASRQMLLLSRSLKRHGFDVHVAVLGGRPRVGRESGPCDLPIVHIGRRWAIDPVADLRLAQHIAQLEPDIVHTWDTIPGMFGPLAARLARHGWSGWGRALSQSPARPRLIAGIYRIERYVPAWDDWWLHRFSSYAERIITDSVSVRDWCAAQNLPANKLAIIPPGVPSARKSELSRDELLQQLRLPPDARLIGVIGRLVPENRVQDLIWAADLLRVLHDDLRMLVIGEGPLRTQLEQYARMASDLDHIHFLGERDDLWRIAPHLDVLWNGSDNRSISIASLEAMAAGVPVIASDVPVNREVVVHGETGFLVPLGVRSGRADRARHTHHIFTDPALAARLRAAASQRVNSRFTLDRMVERQIELYRT